MASPNATIIHTSKKIATIEKETYKHNPFTVVTLSQWLQIDSYDKSSNRDSILPLIDLRSTRDYETKCISFQNNMAITGTKNNNLISSTTTIVNLPWESLHSGERSCELPPRYKAFAILIGRQHHHRHQYHQQNNGSEEKKRQDVLPNKDDKNDENTSISSTFTVHEQIQDFFLAIKSKKTHQSRCQWKVQQVLLESEHLWKEAERLGLLHDNTKRSNIISRTAGITNIEFPLPRLWQPDPLVSSKLLQILCNFINQTMHIHKINYNKNEKNRNNHSKTSDFCSTTIMDTTLNHSRANDEHFFEVWDLGSGSGRDICFLAEECLAHYNQQMSKYMISSQLSFPLRFIGIDNHKGSAHRCVPFWKHRMIDSISDTKLLDLKKIHLFHDALLSSPSSSHQLKHSNGPINKKQEIRQCKLKNKFEYENKCELKCKVILCYSIRYLNRNLLSYLVSNDCPLKSGSIFAMSHFCKPTIDAEWNFDHPKVKSVLERNELRDLFQNDNNHNRWEILQDEICMDGDHGRTLIQFIAKKL